MKKLFNILLPASMVLGLSTPLYAQEGTFVEVAETTATTVKEVTTADALTNAIENANSGDTVQLTENITLSQTLNITIAANKKVTLDLNGHDITLKTNSNNALMKVSKTDGTSTTLEATDLAELVLTNSVNGKGKVESSDNASVIHVGEGVKLVTKNINVVFSDQTKDEKANGVFLVKGEMIVESGTNITSSEGGIGVMGDGAKLIFNDGTIVSEYYAVTGNGTQSGTETTINGGILIANNGAGIYHPQGGTLTLNGGTITGLTGVQMCAGNLVIPETSTVKVVATGEDKRTDKGAGDGVIDDGRAISLINRTGYNGAPKANIAGGSFVSQNEKIKETILAYSWNAKAEGEKHSEWKEATTNSEVTGGQFNKSFDDAFVKSSSFLAVDGTYYVATKEKLASVVEKADDSIVILKNVTELNNVPGGVTVENKTGSDVTVNGTVIKDKEEINIPTSSGGVATQKLSKVYRAYDPNNGEHLYTLDEKEYKHVTSLGWHDEGVAFMAEEEKNGQALYRVYNPNSGLHHYTLDEKEKNTLVSLGWRDEKVAWYTSKKPQSAPVFRVYNPNDGNHHYTMNKQEKDVLVSLGWHDEGLAFRTAPIEK